MVRGGAYLCREFPGGILTRFPLKNFARQSRQRIEIRHLLISRWRAPSRQSRRNSKAKGNREAGQYGKGGSDFRNATAQINGVGSVEQILDFHVTGGGIK